MKKTLLSFFSFIMISILFLCAFSASAETIASGSCGENLTYDLDSNGTLTISGTGSMTNWSQYSSSHGIPSAV